MEGDSQQQPLTPRIPGQGDGAAQSGFSHHYPQGDIPSQKFSEATLDNSSR